MSLVFVAAEPREFDGIVRRAESIQKLPWPVWYARQAELGGKSIVLVADGHGPKLAARAAGEARKRLNRVEGFISTGFCGGLRAGMDVCTIVSATSVNGEPVAQVRAEGAVSGPVLSQDRVASSIEAKQRLAATGAVAVEMEAAGVLEEVRTAGVPFYCVRVVTDTATQSFALDFNAVRRADGRFSTARILLQACRHPGRLFPELVRLHQISKTASIALGEFLVNCRF